MEIIIVCTYCQAIESNSKKSKAILHLNQPKDKSISMKRGATAIFLTTGREVGYTLTGRQAVTGLKVEEAKPGDEFMGSLKEAKMKRIR